MSEFIGYVVSSKKPTNLDGLLCHVTDESQADQSKPILIVGWQEAKSHEGYKSVIDRGLCKDKFWTFSKSESRSDFEKDMSKFVKYCYEKRLEEIRYFYVNVISVSITKLKKLVSIFKSEKRKNIYISNDMVYVPFKGDILGVSLSVLSYCGVKKDKVIEKIKSNVANKVIDGTKSYVVSISKRLGNKKYALPYFV